jgi:uncharacterized protein YjeT (DUF2065 family)
VAFRPRRAIFIERAKGSGVTDLLTALALMIALEGVLYALFPGGMQAMMRVAIAQPPATLRLAGLLAATVGVLLVWWIRG